MEIINELKRILLEENTPQEWLIALIAFAVALTVLVLARNFLVARLTKLAGKTKNKIDDVLVEAFSRTRFFTLLLVSFWISTNFLVLEGYLKDIFDGFIIVVILIQIGIWANAVLGDVVVHFVRLEIEDETSQVATSSALTFIGKLALWSILFLVALENLGVDVSTLVASLGVGGIAIALAAQSILGDLFASLSIMFDKPFVVGDFIIVGDMLGTVEKVGLKTTRVRSLGGEQLIFSNNDLLSSRVRNYKRMEERRILFTIGVTYQTPHAQIQKIPEMIKTIVDGIELTRFDRSHFKNYGDSSLVFETVYWVLVPDYNQYMDIQQEINLELYKKFEEEGIEFAYPTRTIHMVSGEAGGEAG